MTVFMEKTRVAIVGMGTVGTGVARLLLDHGDRLARHAGRILWLEKATVRDLKKNRGIQLPKGILTDDLDSILKNPEIEVVAHLVGGIEPARTIMLQLLDAGKDVVTANKALLAEHGEELFDRASVGANDRIRGQCRGRYPHHCQYFSMFFGQPNPIRSRHPQRH
jgi:homoserine dehydrogenase